MIGLEHLHSVFSVSRLKQHHENSHSNLKLLYLSIKQPRITRSIHENCRFSVNPPKVFRVPRVQRVPRWWSSLGISHSSAQSIGYPHRCFCGKVQVIEVSKYNSLILMTCFRKIHQNGSAHVNIYIYISIYSPQVILFYVQPRNYVIKISVYIHGFPKGTFRGVLNPLRIVAAI